MHPEIVDSPLGRYRLEPCKGALNKVRGMPFQWSVNPYMGCVHRCTFCFVRAFEKTAQREFGDEYGLSIRVKTNVVEVLRKELARPSWKRDTVVLGTATDPYQPAEGKFRLSRGCIRELGAARTPIHIITRGPMAIRDLDVLQEAARHADVHITFSIPTIDEEVWRKTEPGTAPPAQRLKVIKQLVDGGIKVGVGMAPILPGLSDDPEGMDRVVAAVREAGAVGVWANLLYLRPGTKEHFLMTIERDYPDLLPHYQEIYGGGAYADRAEIDEVKKRVAALARKHKVRDRRENTILPELQLSLI